MTRSRHGFLMAAWAFPVAVSSAFACSASDSPAPAAPSQATAPEVATAPEAAPRLAYFAESGGSFELRLVNPRSGGSETLDVLTSAPAAVAWSLDAPTVVTLSADGAYRIDYARPPYASVPIGEAPPAEVEVVDLWLDDSGTLQAVGWSAAKSTCSLFDVPETGAWTRLSEQVENAADLAGPSCAVFADGRRAGARSRSSAQLMQQYQCATSRELCDTDPKGGLEADLEAIHAANPNFDSLALIRGAGASSAAVLGVGVGDTPHLLQPLYFSATAEDGAKRIDLPTASQVQVGVAGPLLLVAEEYSGNDPVVFDLSRGEVLFHAQGSGAVWLPNP